MGNASLQFIKPAGQVLPVIAGLADVWGHIEARLSHSLSPEGGLCALCSPGVPGVSSAHGHEDVLLTDISTRIRAPKRESQPPSAPAPPLTYMTHRQAGCAGFMMSHGQESCPLPTTTQGNRTACSVMCTELLTFISLTPYSKLLRQ